MRVGKVKERIKNKRGASIMEFFIITVVALVVGAIIFELGGSIKTGITKGKKVVDNINENIIVDEGTDEGTK